MQTERYATESDILARVTELSAQGFAFDPSNEAMDSGFSPSIIAYRGAETIRLNFYAMRAPWHAKRTHAYNQAESLIAQATPETLTAESAVAYVEKTFAGSFNKVLYADMTTDCGMDICIVAVESEGVICRAYVWHDTESGKLYGEL